MSSPSPAEQVVPITEAARQLGLPYAMLYRLVRQGRVPSVVVSGITRVRLSALRACISDRAAL